MREVRVAAVADYLIGVPYDEIERKWGVNSGSLHVWMSRVSDHFKKRQRTCVGYRGNTPLVVKEGN